MNRAQILAMLAITVAIVAVHANGLDGPFVFDDVTSIADNPAVHSLWPPWRPFQTPPDRTVSGRPVAALTLAINHALGGLNPRGYHLFNVALHLANALLAFSLIRRTLEGGRLGASAARACLPIAAVVATVWGVHPLAGSCVTYVIQRTELLVGFFLLVTLLAVSAGAGAARSSRWSVVAVAACAAGMGSKEVMVAAPILVLLFDGIFLAPSIAAALRARPGLYAGLASTWLVFFGLIAMSPHGKSAGFSLAELSAWEYARSQPGVILYYLRLAGWPSPLSIDYSDWRVPYPVTQIIPVAGVVAALVAGSAWGLLRRSWLGYLGAWFFLILAPSSSIVPLLNELAAERRMYLPLLAVVALAVASATWMMRAIPATGARRVVATVLVAGVVTALGATTSRRNAAFRSDVALWSATVSARPFSARARNNLGHALFRLGRVAEAIPHLARAVALDPDYADARSNLGAAFYTAGRISDAIPELTRAIRIDPDQVEAHYNLALAFHVEERLDEAIREYRETLRLAPGELDARANLGVALASLGRNEEAVTQLREVLRRDPGHGNARVALERLLRGR